MLGIFLTAQGKFHFRANKRDYLYICLSGIAMGASWMFLYEAYHQIGVGISSLLYYCGPVIVMILSRMIFREKLTIPKIVGFLAVIFGIVWILILGVLNAGIGCYLYFSPLSKLPVQTVSILGYLEPLSAVLFAVLLLHETMTVPQIIGAICIIGGAMIGELIKPKEKTLR